MLYTYVVCTPEGVDNREVLFHTTEINAAVLEADIRKARGQDVSVYRTRVYFLLAQEVYTPGGNIS